MSADEYTLLIVESPVIARILQRASPPHINILATHGYCWKPEYLPKKHQLKARANPEQREFRKELKEQAQWAVNIVIATDPDPSGDFLAWALSRFLKRPQILRGSVKSLDRNGVLNTVRLAVPADPGELHNTLKNRSMIRHEWAASPLPDPEISALAAAFSSSIPFTTFFDESRTLFHSSEPVPALFARQLKTDPPETGTHYRLKHPLSTYEAVEKSVTLKLAGSRREAQKLLQDLFTTEHGLNHESLISYPRASVSGFHPETWHRLQAQHLKIPGLPPFRPDAARSTLPAAVPHESLHPLSLSASPEKVSGSLPAISGRLYEMIYRDTLEAITIPEPAHTACRLSCAPQAILFPDRPLESKYRSLTPARTLPELGIILNRYGTLSPSSFGTRADRWISNSLIQDQNGWVLPGKKLLPWLNRSAEFHDKLTRLAGLAQRNNLTPATIRSLITS